MSYEFHREGEKLVIDLDSFAKFCNEIMDKSDLTLINETLPDGGNGITIERILREKIIVL